MSKEETQQVSKAILQMTNIDLFRSSTQDQQALYPSAFSLIKNVPHTASKHVTLASLTQGNFPVLMYKIKDLVWFSTMMLQTSSFASNKYTPKHLKKLVQSIALKYNSVPYHNFSHAFSLALMNYQCLAKQPDMKSLYTQEEYFYILMAGLSHDLNHRGTNNSFEVKRHTDLALQFKNQSVLQNMHIQTLWKILQANPQQNFLQQANDKNKAKEIITRLILSTDMAYHFKSLTSLRQYRTQRRTMQKQDFKWFMMEQLFHACDIGNPCLDYDNYISWSALLSYQFKYQTILEEEMHLEVTKSFIYHDLTTIYRDQFNFLGEVVQPLWKELSFHFPQLNEFVVNIQNNIRKVNAALNHLKQ